MAQGPQTQLLRIFIDHEAGITVDDCETVSRQVADVLEVEQAVAGEYTLEVSSPGVDRRLFTLAHHQDFIGSPVSLRLRAPVEGRRRFKGELLEVDGEEILLAVDGERFRIPFHLVEKSKLVPDWAEIRNR